MTLYLEDIMDALKKLVTLIIVIAAGYFLYHFFVATPDTEYDETEETIPAYALPSIPETCQSNVQELEKAIYGHGSHQSSAGHLNIAHRELESCLREAGFSEAEISGTVEQIKIKIQGYLKKDGY